jgi:hypothetical protein
MIARLLLLSFLLVPSLARAAKPPANAFDVPWRTSREQAVEILTKQHRARFVTRLSSDTLLLFTGGVWEDWRLQNLQLALADGGLARATAFFADRDDLPPDFDAVAEVLVDEYGRPVAKSTSQAAWEWEDAGAATIRIELAMAPAGLRLTFSRERRSGS